MTLPIMDMSDWTIGDYEIAFAGLNQMLDAGHGMLNQPRCAGEGTVSYRPGADFVADIVEGWMTDQVDAMFEHLKSIRFEDPDDDDRRVRILLRFGVENIDMTVAQLIELALSQSVLPA